MAAGIKRHISIQPLSREHHHGLLLCWKIRTGQKLQVPSERIKAYTDWFFINHLLPHFKAEEEIVFPVLGNENELVKRALSEHRRLKRLFDTDNELSKTLAIIEEELEAHIRFEERVLFNQIQLIATPGDLEKIEQLHTEITFCDDWQDKFWEKKTAGDPKLSS